MFELHCHVATALTNDGIAMPPSARKTLGGKVGRQRTVRTAAAGPAPKVGLMGGGGKRWMQQILEAAVNKVRACANARANSCKSPTNCSELTLDSTLRIPHPSFMLLTFT